MTVHCFSYSRLFDLCVNDSSPMPVCLFEQHSWRYTFFLFLICRASLDYFTTHADLVKRQKEAIEKKKKVRKGLASDKDWTGEGFVKETETMVSN